MSEQYAADFKIGVVMDYVEPQASLRLVIRRNYASFCAYLGVPKKHPLAGEASLDFPCHWGVTYTSWGDGSILDKDWYWWGWDYAHCTDQLEFPAEVQSQIDKLRRDQALLNPPHYSDVPLPVKRWSFDEVRSDAFDIFSRFKQAVESALSQHRVG